MSPAAASVCLQAWLAAPPRRRVDDPASVPRNATGAKRRRRWPIAFATLSALALGVTVLPALALRLLLAPAPGEWSHSLRWGPFEQPVGVPSALRLATAPWLGPWLDGRSWQTRWGPMRSGWNPGTRTLTLHCAPCTLPVPALGSAPLRVPELRVSLRRDVEQLEGELQVAAGPARPLALAYTGDLSQQGLALRIDAPAAPIAHWYALLVPQLPELRQARIEGRVAWRARLALPSGRFSVEPELTAFAVQGLGSERLLDAASACGRPARLRPNDWLTRAVLAAEDQRFHEHPGYDLRELSAALAANQAQEGVRRGGSTITQQLAKRLVTGDDRSLERKLRELLYAVEMEQTLGKARILRLYLDNAPWGAGVCGAEAAARHHFGRGARSLTPAQAVWLAAMLHNPDAEAERWRASGAINLPRAQWVAEGVRGIPGVGRRQRERVVQELAALGS